MSLPITIPFFAFRLHFSNNLALLNPMTDVQAFRLGKTLKDVASEYQSALQEQLYNQTPLLPFMDLLRSSTFYKANLDVEFPSGASSPGSPAFSLSFDYFFEEHEQTWRAILPALGLEASATIQDDLAENLMELVRIDFRRKGRLFSIQDIISTIWYKSTELIQAEIKLEILDPGEKRPTKEFGKFVWLDKVASKVSISRQESYGCEKELQQVLRILRGGYPNNLLIIGPSGVGKTAIIWEAARQLQLQNPDEFIVWETTASTLIKELSQDRGWEFNLSELLKEIANTPHILYIRNLMDLFEVGQYQGNEASIAEFFTPYLSQGQIRMISECTEDQFARIELNAPGYPAYFQVLHLTEPREEQLEQIILEKVKALAEQADILISEEAVNEVIRLHRRFMPYAGMPGKPIRFLEGMALRMGKTKNSSQDFSIIDRNEVIRYFCAESGMPPMIVDPAISLIPGQVKSHFYQQVFGQELAVDAVVDAMVAIKTALSRTGKPIASFLFAGPTGVGKTELAKVLTGFMFGDKDRMVRFDMSEYGTPGALLRLAGAGSTEGLLTSAIRKQPFSVLLFDEIEKAHSNFFDLLLQLLGEGRLTDNRGRVADFCSAIIIMTTNLGADSTRPRPGFGSTNRPTQELYQEAIKRYFRPELVNRIDQIIAFQSLDKTLIRAIVNREIEQFKTRDGMRYRKLELSIQENALELLAEEGFHPKYGGRQLQRAIRELIALPLANQLNLHDPTDKLNVVVKAAKGKVKVEVEPEPTPLEELLDEFNLQDAADQASVLRASANVFKESHLFTLLLQELDNLEESPSHEEENKDPVYSAQAEFRKEELIDIRNKVEQLVLEVEDLEQRLCLAVLGTGTAEEQISEVDQWEEKFFRLKVEVYEQANPSANTVYLSIYGEACEKMRPVYFSICAEREFEFSFTEIWFRESLYNHPAEDSKEIEQYLLVEKADIGTFIPQAGDRLIGIILKINGPGVQLFFAGESGIQKWHNPQRKETLLAELKVSEHKEVPPKGIHQKNYFNRLPIRRSLEFPQIKDNVWRINRQLAEDQYFSYLLFQLEQQFKLNLDNQF
jgi:ATP-dependent Clp protease ATP-binding subunit ClpA